MRILIYGLNYAPEPTGVGKYTSEMAEWLTEQGHEVLVVTAPMYYPRWAYGPGYAGASYQAEQRGETKVIRCPLYVPKRPSGFLRCLHLASFSFSSSLLAVWQALKWRADVVFTIAPTLLCAPAACVAARFSGAVSWIHFQDFEVNAAFKMGLLPRSGFLGSIKAVERWLLRRFNVVSTISPKMKQTLIDEKANEAQLFLLPNWVDTNLVFPSPSGGALRRELKILPTAVVVLYAGSINGKSGLETVAQAARILSEHKDIHFIFCGEGTKREELGRSVQDLPNVRFYPVQPAEKMNAMMNMADIHLLPQQSGVAECVMPSKLTTICAVGGAVVACVAERTELENVVQKISGMTCAAEDAMAFAQKILQLAEDPMRRKKMGKCAREYALENFDKSKLLSALAGKLRTSTLEK